MKLKGAKNDLKQHRGESMNAVLWNESEGKEKK